MEFETERIAGKTCRIWHAGQGGPMVYWGTAERDDGLESAVVRQLRERTKGRAWTLAAYEVAHWNQDFSPWALPSVRGEDEFTGGARETLKWLTDACIPALERGRARDCSARLIGGYSLAGLFSLLAFYESGLFDGVASCSGSLWYPGWKAYAQRQSAPEGSAVYLSLGRKEERTRSPRMAAVGEMTRWQAAHVRNDGRVRASELVWHNGGHFTEVEARVAQGFAWLIDHLPDGDGRGNGI